MTGALGHIGSRLIRELPGAFPGCEVVMIDDLSTRRYCSLFDLPRRGRYRFFEADVLDAELGALLKGCDAVVHLAALTDAAGSFSAGARYRRINAGGTERVGRFCAAAGVPLLFVSTTSVYSPRGPRVAEDCPASELKPQSPYAASKLSAERRLSALGRSRGLRFATLRFGTIVGASPGMGFHTAVPRLCWQACRGLPLTLWRSAVRQSRPYLELGDAARAIVFMLRARRFEGEVYNAVTEAAAIGEIAACLRRLVPGARTRLVDHPGMNRLSYTADASKLKALGFRFTGSLRKGIAETVELLGRL